MANRRGTLDRRGILLGMGKKGAIMGSVSIFEIIGVCSVMLLLSAGILAGADKARKGGE